MRYQHKFTVDAPLESVIEFHSKSINMKKITPWPIKISINQSPVKLVDGDLLDFTMWLGPLPIQWSAVIVSNSSTSFTDRLIEGPFKRWEHIHAFEAIDEARSTVRDVIIAQLHDSPTKWLIGIGMWIGLPVLFAFRTWKTKKLLRLEQR